MSFRKFLLRLSNSFFKWWWAAGTGVASILGWIGTPESGVTLSRSSIAFAVFFVLALVFLVVSAVSQSYDWFVNSELHPRVTRVVAGQAGDPFTFVLRANSNRPLAAGHLLSVHREVGGVEVCIAILCLSRPRQDGKGEQCEAVWLTPGHARDLAQGKVALDKPQVRRDIPWETVTRMISEAK